MPDKKMAKIEYSPEQHWVSVQLPPLHSVVPALPISALLYVAHVVNELQYAAGNIRKQKMEMKCGRAESFLFPMLCFTRCWMNTSMALRRRPQGLCSFNNLVGQPKSQRLGKNHTSARQTNTEKEICRRLVGWRQPRQCKTQNLASSFLPLSIQ